MGHAGWATSSGWAGVHVPTATPGRWKSQPHAHHARAI